VGNNENILSLRDISIDTGSDDREGLLVLNDGSLVAVLVRLSATHGPDAGRWYLEAGFGRCATAALPTFPDLDDAQRWIEGRLDRRAL